MSAWLPRALFGLVTSFALAAACSASVKHAGDSGSGGAGFGGAASASSQSASSAKSSSAVGLNDSAASGIGFDGGACTPQCSPDGHTIIECDNTTKTCPPNQLCDQATGDCADACTVAKDEKRSVGCEYYATFMDQYNAASCFAVFVANNWDAPVHINVDYKGGTLPIANFARIPAGSGPTLTYGPYDANAGLPVGEVAILFLSGPQGPTGQPGEANCPIQSAVPSGVMLSGITGIGDAFHITTDAPVVAYEINPYGGGSAAVTAASLLLPTSVWDTNYVAVNIAPYDNISPIGTNPSMNIVAAEDATTVTIVPVAPVQGGGGIPSGPTNTPLVFQLSKGQHAQITQQAELTGSVISSNKPVGFMAGHNCMHWPQGFAYCDHGEQMVPPVKALGNEYVGVMYRPRIIQETITGWRLVGTVDGTQLTFNPPISGAPSSLGLGQVAEFQTGTPFVVSSQDNKHPFMLFTYMSGSQWLADMSGYGDPDCVISVPPEQYLDDYVFFADPTYPETNLVVVRKKGSDMMFHDVTLDCAGVLTGWQAVGDYEWTRVDLITGDFQGVNGCSTGRHEIKSDATFGLWVWGWGTPTTTIFTANVSYGYPGGMSVTPINEVVIPPNPK